MSFRKAKKYSHKYGMDAFYEGPMRKSRKIKGVSKTGKRASGTKRNIPTGPILSALTSKGNPAKNNSTVKMKLHDLRRLISAARTGKRVKVKARVR